MTCGAAPPSAMTRSARASFASVRVLRHHETGEVLRLGDGGGQADAGELRREAKQPRQPERKQVAALRGDQRVQFVEDHALERAEQIRRVGGREQQRKLLRRGEQDVRRITALALPFRGRRVAGAGLDPDRQPHFGDRRFEVARDVDRERLQRRDVERVQAARALKVAAGGDELAFCRHGCRWRGEDGRSIRPGSAEIRRASCRRRSARSTAPSGRRAPWPEVRADARAASSRGRRTSARMVRAMSPGVRGPSLQSQFMQVARPRRGYRPARLFHCARRLRSIETGVRPASASARRI